MGVNVIYLYFFKSIFATNNGQRRVVICVHTSFARRRGHCDEKTRYTNTKLPSDADERSILTDNTQQP